MSKSNDGHSRGRGFPSSLESFHHVDSDGEVVYSAAQREAISGLTSALSTMSTKSTEEIQAENMSRHEEALSAEKAEAESTEPSSPADR